MVILPCSFIWWNGTYSSTRSFDSSKAPGRERVVLLWCVVAPGLPCSHPGRRTIYYYESYGDVIVVVGMNPTKKYLVSPEQRATLIRRMLEPYVGVAKHVRVQGA